jgi:hypothetical protein
METARARKHERRQAVPKHRKLSALMFCQQPPEKPEA